MSLPEIELFRVKKLFSRFCEQRIPPDVRDQIKLIYIIKGNKVVLVESRPFFNDPTKWTEMPVAQFEYIFLSNSWSLFAYDSRSRRFPYSKGKLDKLIQEVDTDHTGIFWG